jgi:acetyltransferase-like isoleucine patch superfamily enzyme
VQEVQVTDPQSLGDGTVTLDELSGAGPGCVIEPGVRIFGSRWVHLGEKVYLGHDAYLRAYAQGSLRVGDGCWIGPKCVINSFGGVTLGRRVGVGPGVKILSSVHAGGEPGTPILDTPLRAEEVVVEEGADIGAGAVLLPGTRVGAFAQVGAGAVVTGRVPARSVVAGVPARPLRSQE